MLLPKVIEIFLIAAANGNDTRAAAVPEIIRSTYEHDLDTRKLEIQVLPNLVNGNRDTNTAVCLYDV